MFRGFHHAAVQVHDVSRVADFYVQILGLPELRRFHRDDGSLRSVWVALSADTSGSPPFLAIENDPRAGQGPLGFSMVALRIDPNARAQLRTSLTSKGLTIERETDWTMYTRDPEGNLIGFSHHPEPGVERASR